MAPQVRQGGVEQNAVARALAAISLDTTRRIDQVRSERSNMALTEIELQFQVLITGEAATSPEWATTTLEFESPMYYAPSNRDSDFDRPHFTFGVVIDYGSPVIVTACVTEWVVDDETDAVKGAVVQVGAFMPDVDVPVPYGGYVHLTFQGYGGISENEAELNDG